MKACVRILSVALVAILLLLALTACATKIPKGEYVLSDVKNKLLQGYYESYQFDGDKFSYSVYRGYQLVEEESYSGKYTIEKNEEESEEGIIKGTITFTVIGADGTESEPYNKTLHYDELEGRLVIGDLVFFYYEFDE